MVAAATAVGIHAVPADDEDSRMTGLEPSTHGPSPPTMETMPSAMARSTGRAPENIDQNSRQPPAFVAVRLRIEFGGSAGRRLHLSVVEDGLPVAVHAQRRDAEQVLDAEGESHLFVVLHLAHAHEEIAVLIGVVQLEGREDVRFAPDLQQ